MAERKKLHRRLMTGIRVNEGTLTGTATRDLDGEKVLVTCFPGSRPSARELHRVADQSGAWDPVAHRSRRQHPSQRGVFLQVSLACRSSRAWYSLKRGGSGGSASWKSRW